MMRRPQRVLLVVNPVARTVSRPTIEVIEKALAADFKLDVVETVQRGHATEVAADAVGQGMDLVVVFSGDGTINEVVNALAGTGVAMGVIPGGATNILVRALGIPADPVDATGLLIRRALAGRARPISLGRAGERFFAVNCGAGLDAAAMARLESKFPHSKRSYDRAAFLSVLRSVTGSYAGREPDLSVWVDDGDPTPSVSVLIGTTEPYSYFKRWGLRVLPEAGLGGGLDVLSVRRLPRRRLPRIAWQVLVSGKVARSRDMDYAHDAERVQILGERAFPVQVDGDYLGQHRALAVSLHRRGLSVVA